MSIAPGGLIKQAVVRDTYPANDWDLDNSIIVNLQLINPVVFESLTGMKLPPTPITAAIYAKSGFPYYAINEEPTGIVGKFEGMKSVDQMDRENRQQTALHKQEDKILTRIIPLSNLHRTFTPVSQMVEKLKKSSLKMSLLLPSRELSVTLQDLVSSGHKTIRVTYGGGDHLNISLHRTIRVPDNPRPDCGPFPIYSIKEYKEKLPNTMIGKVACSTNLCRPFAIKMYAGGVNVVSGEPVSEGLATMLRRKQRISEGKSIQDYIVSGFQKWIDRVTKIDGNIMQFVATPTASGYSVGAQVAGRDSLANLQIEVMPKKRKPMCIVVRTLNWKSIPIDEVDGDTTAGGLKNLLQRAKGILMDEQCLIYGGCQLEDNKKLSECNITHESVVYLNQLAFGSGSLQPADLAIKKMNADGMTEKEVITRVFTKQIIVKDPIAADQ
ncbi:hypothetical protein IFR05_009135 [Cadophora sp. M221]|nr:hypothetical protein IFR05_009135 [Cadophora sp. M221]